MILHQAPAEVTKHILSFIRTGRVKQMLYSASKSLRKHLPKARLTHKVQGRVLGYFGHVGDGVVFDSPMVVGFVRLYFFMNYVEQQRLIDWMQGYQGGRVCVSQNGLFFHYGRLGRTMPVPRLFAPYPMELWEGR